MIFCRILWRIHKANVTAPRHYRAVHISSPSLQEIPETTNASVSRGINCSVCRVVTLRLPFLSATSRHTAILRGGHCPIKSQDSPQPAVNRRHFKHLGKVFHGTEPCSRAGLTPSLRRPQARNAERSGPAPALRARREPLKKSSAHTSPHFVFTNGGRLFITALS